MEHPQIPESTGTTLELHSIGNGHAEAYTWQAHYPNFAPKLTGDLLAIQFPQSLPTSSLTRLKARAITSRSEIWPSVCSSGEMFPLLRQCRITPGPSETSLLTESSHWDDSYWRENKYGDTHIRFGYRYNFQKGKTEFHGVARSFLLF